MNLSRYRVIGLAVILTVAGKLMAFGKDVILSSVYGAGPATDAYFIANTIPSIMWTTFAATIGLVFMPLYTAARQRSVLESSRFVNAGIRLYALVAVVLTVLCVVGAPWIVAITAPAAPAEIRHVATVLTRIMALGFVFTGYVAIQNAVQQSNGRFLSPLVAPVAGNAMTIAGIAASLWGGGIYTVVSFSVIGWVLQAPLQRLRTLKFYRRRRPLQLPNASIVAQLLSLPVMAGVLLDQLNLYIGINLGSGFGSGSISHLSYAGRLTLFLSGVVSVLVSYFLFPTLASAAARADHKKAATTLTLGSGLVAAGTMPIAILAIMYAPQMVTIVFERGRFGAADVFATAAIFRLYALGILFIGLREMLNRVFYSYQRNAVPLIVGLLSAVTNLGTSWLLIEHVGISGIAAGASIGAAVYVACQLIYIAFWRRHLLEMAQMRWWSMVALASAAMVATAWLTSGFGARSALLNLVLSGGAAAVAYMIMALLAMSLLSVRLRS